MSYKEDNYESQAVVEPAQARPQDLVRERLTKSEKRRRIWNDFNAGFMGNSLKESAENTLNRIAKHRVGPDDNEQNTHFGQFVIMLRDIINLQPPEDPGTGGASSATTPPPYVKTDAYGQRRAASGGAG